jgi:UDP-N-acetylglucosamine acyltransferase
MGIHPTALLSSSNLPTDISVGPYCIVENGVCIGSGSRMAAHSILRSGSELSTDVQVDSFAVVGGAPQALSFKPDTPSGVRIGAASILREGVTVHRSTTENGYTAIGANCLLMCHAHVGHDCVVGDGVTLANNTMLGGHVQIGARAFIGGGAGIHQFVRIGELAMIAGNASISADVPPFIMVAERNEACGLNLVGLRRAGLSTEIIVELKKCYRAVFFGGGNPANKAQAARESLQLGQSSQAKAFLDFFQSGKRGFVRSRHSYKDE